MEEKKVLQSFPVTVKAGRMNNDGTSRRFYILAGLEDLPAKKGLYGTGEDRYIFSKQSFPEFTPEQLANGVDLFIYADSENEWMNLGRSSEKMSAEAVAADIARQRAEVAIARASVPVARRRVSSALLTEEA